MEQIHVFSETSSILYDNLDPNKINIFTVNKELTTMSTDLSE